MSPTPAAPSGKSTGAQTRRDSFDLQQINRIVADQTKTLHAEITRLTGANAALIAQNKDYHAMCDRIWKLVHPRDELPCDVILAEANARLGQENKELRAALERTTSMLRDVCGDLEDGHDLRELRGKYFQAVLEVADIGMETLQSTAPRIPRR